MGWARVKVTVVGAGNMGRGIGMRLSKGGHEVEIVDRQPADAQALAEEISAGSGTVPARAVAPDGKFGGDVVVLAVPYQAVADIVAGYRDQLAGRIVVDISNPLDFTTMDALVTPADSSAAEEIAKQLPSDAPVVKAFNTTFAGTLVAGEVAGQQLDVLVAGDDAAAKQTVISLVDSSGLRGLDVGPLRRARQLEHLGFLHIVMQEPLGSGFGSAIKLHW